MSETATVYIYCVAYNHERYIRQCLDSFVMQQTNFKFVAVVHDDASTDHTADIIREYAANYPDIIHPIIETENQYSKHDGSLTRIMEENTLSGEYVAMCDGDDYWTDPLKLQKQYDLMESHPEYSLCFHAHINQYSDGSKIEIRPTIIKAFYTIEDAILSGGGFMATSSMFYRARYLREERCPAFRRQSRVGDLPRMLFHASKGQLGYIDEAMSVYRAGSAGSWNSSNSTWKVRRQHFKATQRMYKEFDEYTHYQYHKVIVRKNWLNLKGHWRRNFKFFIKNLRLKKK